MYKIDSYILENDAVPTGKRYVLFGGACGPPIFEVCVI